MTTKPVVSPVEDGETDMKWRDLALQFDGHRIEALALLRYVSGASNSDEAIGRVGEIKAFLAAPPLSGEKVLADRIGALASRCTAEIGMRVKLLEWTKGGEVFCAQTPFGEYTVEHYDDGDAQGWQLTYDDTNVIGHFPTDHACFAAAQADFDQRIRSALTEPERAAEPVAWLVEGRDFPTENFSWREIAVTEKPVESNRVRNIRPLYATPSPVQAVTEEMVERAARAMEPMAFREEFTATDEWYELEQEGRNQALGRARAALSILGGGNGR